MKLFYIIIMLFMIPPAFSKGIMLNLSGLTLNDAITLFYTEVVRKPFMVSPELITDKRQVNFNITPDMDEYSFMIRYLQNAGVSVTKKHGVDYFYLQEKKVYEAPKYSFVYTPQYRSVAYLADILQSQVSGSFSNGGQIGHGDISPAMIKDNTASNFLSRNGDVLVFYGTFAKTETGVNNSPTLIKRELNTDVSLKDGDIILLGGLAENKDSNADTGLSFLPSWFGTTATEKAKTDIIIVLQARKIRR
ncbi:TPA: hypothetical protein MLC85_004300 [Salmonella enterica subsp. enterica serovar Anfo]|nr:hypothetical protein [Salmonella enterica subsp. enterica serovar Anfo]